MMDVFRRAAQGWTAKILIGLLVLSFAVWGIADVFTGFRSGTLATVGSQDISADQFANTYRDALQNYSRQVGENVTPEKAREIGIDRQILNEMIRGMAVMSEAQTLKLTVGDVQIATEVAKNPNFGDAQGKFDPALFKQYLQRNGQSESGFLAAEREQLLRSAVAETVQSDLYLPSAFVEAVSAHNSQQRDARYFVIKAQASEVPPPADQEIKGYYDNNPMTYTAPEYRSIAVIKAEPADISANIQISGEDVAAGYEKYKADYFAPERRTILQTTFPSVEEAAKAKARIAAGEDFLAIAKERGFSEQDATWADRAAADILDPAVAAAAFALKEGEISAPVEGQLAVMLVKAQKIIPDHQQTIDEARDAVTKRLQLERAAEEIRSIYETVEDARAAQTPFEEIAKTAKIPFVTVSAVDAAGKDKDGKDIDIPHKQELLKLAFESEAGVENDAFNTSDDGYVWYEIREIVPSAVRPYDAVMDQVKADLSKQKLRELATAKASKIVESAKSGRSFDDLAKESGAEIKSVQGIKRNESSPDFDPAAVMAVFGAVEGGVTFAPEADGEGAKIIQSQAVLAAPFDPKSAEATQIRTSMSRLAGGDILGSYLVSLQNEQGFTVNETLWRQITGAPAQ